MDRWRRYRAMEILGNPDPELCVAIISFNIRDEGDAYLHSKFVTTLLNDLFGIRSRAGCSCPQNPFDVWTGLRDSLEANGAS